MTSFDHAARESASLAYDGDEPVAFQRLALEPPRVERALGRDFVVASAGALAALASRAFTDMQFRLRPTLASWLARAAASPGASDGERFALRALMDNALVAAEGRFPLCQDTGTATVFGWRGDRLLVEEGKAGDGPGRDEAAFERGALEAWRTARLRNSQVVPLAGLGERNTGTNAPVACHLFAAGGEAYRLLFTAKGGGSSNKAALYQETKRVLEPKAFEAFVERAVAGLGVSACPPYRIVVVLGGQSAEESALAGRLASTGALDALPVEPGPDGGPYRDRELEAVVEATARRSGWGAQFGGVMMARDARVIRLPRHAASLPVSVAVSCIAHRQAYAYVSRDGYFVERLASADDLGRLLEEAGAEARTGAAVEAASQAARRVDLGEPGTVDLRATAEGLVAGELVELWGPVVLARDAAHARLQRMLEAGESLPAWTRYPAFYASPTETPEGAAIGSVGPTTSRRMDSYLEDFGRHGIFPITIGKGERGPACREACSRYRGAYLAAVGGAAALAGSRFVSSCTVIDWPELGMEAIRLVELRGLPALVVTDSRGGDYYERLRS